MMIIRDLPLVWRLTDEPRAPRPDGVPDRMDFEWDWDSELGLLKQRMTPALRTALDAVYAAGSENLGATESYGKEFWNFLYSTAQRRFHNTLAKNTSALEISPGSGWLISKLGQYCQVFRHNGPFPDRCGRKRAYQNHSGSVMRTGGFDMVIAHHVLEHVENPVEFLSAARELLSNRGMVIGCVPDCSTEIRLGDISMATSQHLCYFTPASLALCLEAAGFHGYQIIGNSGSLMFRTAEAGYRCHASFVHALQMNGYGATYGQFITRSSMSARRIRDLIEYTGRVPHDCAMVVPMRGLPYVPQWGGRIFDDGMAGKYLDGVWQEIEPLSAIDGCIHTAFVMSMTHEREIVDKIAGRCKVITLREMLDG